MVAQLGGGGNSNQFLISVFIVYSFQSHQLIDFVRHIVDVCLPFCGSFCSPICGRFCLPIRGRFLADSWAFVGRFVGVRWPIVGCLVDVCYL